MQDERVSAMASYNRTTLSGLPSLIVEGIAVDTKMQGKGFFKNVTDIARKNEEIICLRTQNPRMYRALEKYCSQIYPCAREMPKKIEIILEDLTKYMNCQIDKNGLVKGYYGGLFYGEEPTHEKISPLFRNLGMKLNDGDGLLVVGIK